MTQQCRECGAKLPDGASACLQCGTPVVPAGGSAGRTQSALEFVRPAISGGLLLGLLSSLPLINLANAIFGLWILVGGALTTRLLMKQRPSGVSYGDGAFGGVLSGFFGAIVSTLMLIPDKFFFAAEWEEIRRQSELKMIEVPKEALAMQDLLLRAFSPEVSLTTEMVWFFIYGFLFCLFAMIGGILMVWISNRRSSQGRAA